MNPAAGAINRGPGMNGQNFIQSIQKNSLLQYMTIKQNYNAKVINYNDMITEGSATIYNQNPQGVGNTSSIISAPPMMTGRFPSKTFILLFFTFFF